MHEHFVQFYESDKFLVNQVAAFITAGLQAGEAAVIIPTATHLYAIESRLSASPVFADAGARYQSADAADAATKCIVDGHLDVKRFTAFIEPFFKQAYDAGNGGVRVFGEIVAVAWAQQNYEAAIELEKAWNDLAHAYSFTLFCAYPIGSFSKHGDGDPFVRICNEHSSVLPAESYTLACNAHDHFRTIAILQQKAVALENESALRKKIEETMQRRESQLSEVAMQIAPDYYERLAT